MAQDPPPLPLILGPAILSKVRTDVFGSPRRKQLLSITRLGPTSPARGTSSGASALVAALTALQADEIQVAWPRAHQAELCAVLDVLGKAGFQREEGWPVLGPLAARKEDLLLRLSRADPRSTAVILGPADGQATVTPADRDLVAGLQLEIETAAAEVINGCSFDRKYGVRRIMTAGSTSRGTYAAFPPDFDLVIDTGCERTSFKTAEVEAVCERLVGNLAASRVLEAFGGVISERMEQSSAGRFQIALKSFGVRGPQSLVARYDLVQATASRESRIAFLDVTFGRLPQIIGYEIWIRRLFATLEPVSAERLRAEIRMAKTLLRKLGGVYGSEDRGLRSHAIEQWIIQCWNYRSSRTGVGTLDNALRLLVEEAQSPNAKGGFDVQPFEAFKSRFPLWHPGWWEEEAGFRPPLRNVDLWDLLGDGDGAAAAPKWLKLVTLAVAYDRASLLSHPACVDSLVAAANARVAEANPGRSEFDPAASYAES